MTLFFTVVFYGRHMKARKSTKTWQKTRKPNLLRHKSGNYYARAFNGGKEVWKSLHTSHYSVAEAKLAEFLKEHRKIEELQATIGRQRKDSEAKAAKQQKQLEALTAGLQKVSAQFELTKSTPQTVLNGP